MPGPFTHVNLNDVEDSAPKFGFEEVQEARFANTALETEQAGFALERVKPGKRQGFGHRHDEAEEVYVIVSGSGRLKLDDDVIEVKRLDAIRVSPQVTRQFEADDDGLEILAFGARHEGDGEIVPGWWSD
jgi:mannose-6-phosphate isomerase-like protein (cupin superfamily)